MLCFFIQHYTEVFIIFCLRKILFGFYRLAFIYIAEEGNFCFRITFCFSINASGKACKVARAFAANTNTRNV
jgi:hypothetical protein